MSVANLGCKPGMLWTRIPRYIKKLGYGVLLHTIPAKARPKQTNPVAVAR